MTATTENNQGATPVIEIGREALPLSCPRPQDEVWNLHPRVYLPLEQSGEAACPYCGAHYRLAD
ncbi:MAG: zinc-finger domain-containing protein [Candidatus Thiosymbion ectosymbiont of Robbea hypermnestra]|nr:zinc-finger domain-containing protein [Candidatus Thiosymbion ectosymbiont of Robbea hypermnestra]